MYHDPVMLRQSVDGLEVKPEGVYVDVTFGGGGHSAAILHSLNEEGRLIAFDQDPDASSNALKDSRFTLVAQNFSFLKNYLRMYKAIPVDGILADLGVSSHQFDVDKRGFSFRFEGPLDMRMDQKRELTAAKLLKEYSLEELTRVFREYGELKNAYKLANLIVGHRESRSLKTIEEFKSLIEPIAPKFSEHKFFAQVFQALRIEVNQELKVLENLLEQSVEVLKPKGRLAVITYHSLEDRMVKNFFRTGNLAGKQEKDFYGKLIRPLEPVNRKPIIPSPEEIEKNKRARSAKLRIAEKI